MSYISDHRGFGRYGYHPFGMVMKERSKSYKHYRFGFNGMEQADEVAGSGNSLDFGSRIYNSSLGKWLSVDASFSHYPSYGTFSFCLNSPLICVDLDGDDVYIVVYAADNNKNFRNAAATRAREIKSQSDYDKKTDHVYVLEVSDLGALKEQIANVVADANKNGFGETVEFSIYSHAGQDGPRGAVPVGSESGNSDRSLSTQTGNDNDRGQITKNSWKSIDFNFKDGSSIANFYGCNETGFAAWFSSNHSVKYATAPQALANASESPFEYNIPFLGGFGLPVDVWFAGFVEDDFDYDTPMVPLDLDVYSKGKLIDQDHGIITNAFINSQGELDGIKQLIKLVRETDPIVKPKDIEHKDNTGIGSSYGNRGY